MAKTDGARTDSAKLDGAKFDGAKLETAKPVTATLAPADVPAYEPPPENLDRVRDILFGGQMRAVEGRLQALEERMLSEQAQLRSDLGKQIAAVQAEARRELQGLADQQAADRAKRADELEALGAELRDALRGLERRHVKLEELTGKADAELRDGILEQARATAAQIDRLTQRLTTELNREVAALRHDKTDVSAIAGLFSDMAGRLGSLIGTVPGTGPSAGANGPAA